MQKRIIDSTSIEIDLVRAEQDVWTAELAVDAAKKQLLTAQRVLILLQQEAGSAAMYAHSVSKQLSSGPKSDAA